MNISASTNTVTITGNIKSVSDFQSIKATVDTVKNSTSTIIIDIKDSISITSSVIGYFNKLVLKDGIDLNMRVGDAQLMSLIEDLNLTGVFKAKRS
jgi:SUMO ligase MMS21 Smc5/6 complex component